MGDGSGAGVGLEVAGVGEAGAVIADFDRYTNVGGVTEAGRLVMIWWLGCWLTTCAVAWSRLSTMAYTVSRVVASKAEGVGPVLVRRSGVEVVGWRTASESRGWWGWIGLWARSPSCPRLMHIAGHYAGDIVSCPVRRFCRWPMVRRAQWGSPARPRPLLWWPWQLARVSREAMSWALSQAPRCWLDCHRVSFHNGSRPGGLVVTSTDHQLSPDPLIKLCQYVTASAVDTHFQICRI